MRVEAFDENGKSVIEQQGELVCTAPFPSMPIYFWNDPDNQKYHDAYFGVYPNIWRHGDYILITERGGVVIYGRSDATLNPGGVRIGTAEIYRQVDFLEEIEDCVVVGQNWKNDVRADRSSPRMHSASQDYTRRSHPSPAGSEFRLTPGHRSSRRPRYHSRFHPVLRSLSVRCNPRREACHPIPNSLPRSRLKHHTRCRT